MFSFARQRGPVRVLLTDRRLIVLWQGDHHLLPSRARYNAWRSGLAETLSWHLGDADPPRATEQLAWDIPNRLVSNLFAATMRGIGGDRRLSMLNIAVFSEFLTGSRELGRYGETVPLLSLVVYGPAESLNDFLRHTPLATRVSRHWHVGKRLDP